MIKSISKKMKYLLVAVFAFIFSITALVIGMPKAKASDDEVLYKEITLADIIANKDTGKYDIWSWKGIKEYGTNTFTLYDVDAGDPVETFDIVGETDDAIANGLFKVEFTFASNKGNYWEASYGNNFNHGSAGSKTVILEEKWPQYSDDYDLLRKKFGEIYFDFRECIGNVVSQFSIKLYYRKNMVTIAGTKDKGMNYCFLSLYEDARSEYRVGERFNVGRTVYGFVKLKYGYNADESWTLVSGEPNTEGAIYRIGSVYITGVESEYISQQVYDQDYYVINGGTTTPWTKTVTLEDNGTVVDRIQVIYNQETNFPTMEKPGCVFKEWNDKADGSGNTIDSTSDFFYYNVDTIYAIWTYGTEIQNVIDEITGISVNYNNACKNAIDTAKGHYNDLSADYKAVFPNAIYDLLISKENAYLAMDKINAIGTIANTPESKALVDAAKNFYDGLDSDTKALVLSNFVKTLTDDVAVMNVITLVNTIGDLDETDDCRAKIDAAFEAYIGLTNDQADIVPNDVEKTLNDKDSAKTVIDKIKAIGDVEYNAESKGKIDAAQTSYDGLTEDQQALVVNKDKLIQANTDYNAVDNVVGLINLMPDEFDYSDEYKEKLDDAKEAYDALTPYQKSIVPSDIFDKFDNGEKIYNAIDLINNIGKVEYTQSCKEKIDAARSAYDALTAEQKELVDNYQTLVIAEAVYDAMRLIDAIGEVKYTDYCKERIDSARARYNALTAAQKNAVTNYNDLVKAEEEFAKKASDAGTDSKPEAKYERENKENGVHIETKDETAIPEDINLKVEVKTSVKAKELIKEYNNIKKLLKSNSKISKIYDVKLIRTVNGVEEEIQPSDIKDGTNVTIKISMPENLKKFRLLHIHSEDDIEEIKDYVLNNNELEFDCNRLSEFVIVIPGSGVITDNHGFCVGWVVFIIAIVLLVYLALYIFIYFGICEGLIKKLRLDGLKNVSKLLGIINMAICGVVFVFALVSLILHTCPITIASFVLVTLAIAAFVTLFIMYLLKNNKVEEAIEQ